MADQILPNATKILSSHLALNDMVETIKIMPILVCDPKIRQRILEERLEVILSKLLARRFEFTEDISNEVMIDLLSFFSAIVEEEYQVHKNDENIQILKNCIQYEQLLDVIVKSLEGYLQLQKLDWVLFFYS